MRSSSVVKSRCARVLPSFLVELRVSNAPDPRFVQEKLVRIIGGENRELLIVVTRVDDLVKRIAHPISRHGRAQFIQHEYFGLIDRSKHPQF